MNTLELQDRPNLPTLTDTPWAIAPNTTFTSVNGYVQVIDTNGIDATKRFYRIVEQ